MGLNMTMVIVHWPAERSDLLVELFLTQKQMTCFSLELGECQRHSWFLAKKKPTPAEEHPSCAFFGNPLLHYSGSK